MNQRRAQKGGEYGANGDWYEGGKWIANTDRPKRHGSVKPTRRQQVAPWTWETPPHDGARAIYDKWSGTWGKNLDGTMFCRDLPADRWGSDFLAESQAMAERWNNGERWI
jgi:hypothetical protein